MSITNITSNGYRTLGNIILKLFKNIGAGVMELADIVDLKSAGA